MFPVYVSTLDDMILSTLQLVLQTSGCGEAEVVIFVVDKYHCILLDGRAALVLHKNSWSLSKTTSTWSVSVVDENVTDDIGTKTIINTSIKPVFIKKHPTNFTCKLP